MLGDSVPVYLADYAHELQTVHHALLDEHLELPVADNTAVDNLFTGDHANTEDSLAAGSPSACSPSAAGSPAVAGSPALYLQ